MDLSAKNNDDDGFDANDRAALVRGCGLVATTEVRAARRVVDVIATLRATRNQGEP